MFMFRDLDVHDLIWLANDAKNDWINLAEYSSSGKTLQLLLLLFHSTRATQRHNLASFGLFV